MKDLGRIGELALLLDEGYQLSETSVEKVVVYKYCIFLTENKFYEVKQIRQVLEMRLIASVGLNTLLLILLIFAAAIEGEMVHPSFVSCANDDL